MAIVKWISRGLILFFVAVPAFASVTVTPQFNFSSAYDSNVFKLADSEDSSQILFKSHRDDVVRQYGASVDVGVSLFRQRANVKLAWSGVRYDAFRFLNYDASDVQARWNWLFGKYAYGVFGYDDSVSLTDYSDFNAPIDFRNEQRIRTWQSSFAYRLDSRIEIGGGFSAREVRFTNEHYTMANRDDLIFNSAIRYAQSAALQTSLHAEIKQGVYPDRNAATYPTLGDRFEQVSSFAQADWQMTEQSSYVMRTGGYFRRYTHGLRSNIFVPIIQLGWKWTPWSKLSTNVDWKRELAAIDQQAYNYATQNTFSFKLSWRPALRWSVEGSASLRSADYSLDSTDQLSRSDVTTLTGSSLMYNVFDKLQTGLSYQYEWRRSTVSIYEFSRYLASLRLVATF